MRKKGIVYSRVLENDKDSLNEIKKAGFDCLMFGWYKRDKITALSDMAKSIGLFPEIIHAPFLNIVGKANINSMWLEGEEGEAVLEELRETVSVAGDNGIPYVVVHLSSGNNAPCVNDIGADRFDRLIEHACSQNVTLAFENQRKLANIAFIMEKYIDCKYVGFCWDNGHEACFTNGREYMPLFGDKLVCTHIHDNFAQEEGDDHLIPFDGRLDFNRYAEHIKKSGYTGTLLLETVMSCGNYSDMTAEQFLSKAYSAVCKIDEMCEL